MTIKKMSPLITVEDTAPVKAFYETHFSPKITFDMPGRHLTFNLDADGMVELGYMVAEKMPPFSGSGLIVCLEVDDVDAWHEKLTKDGVAVEMPLQDNPWGDRAFTIRDPAGVSIYLYKLIEADEEFKQYMKE